MTCIQPSLDSCSKLVCPKKKIYIPTEYERLARMGTLSGTYKNSIAPFVLLLVCKMINKCASFHPYLQDLRMHQTENKTCVKLIRGLFDATNRGHFSKP